MLVEGDRGDGNEGGKTEMRNIGMGDVCAKEVNGLG